MTKFNSLILLLLSFLIISCGSNSDKKSSYFKLKTAQNKTEYKLGETIEGSIENLKDRQIDSIQIYFQEEYLQTLKSETSFSVALENPKLGRQKLEAVVFSEGETDTISDNLKIYNNQAPETFTYKVINEYPHDQEAYTQGLEFFNDTLYESTGHYGGSSLRKVDLETGEVLEQIALDETYFGEGLSILNNKLYQLTWREGEGFIYNLRDFEKTGSFSYSKSEEGWGLCNDGEKFYKSDGSEKIWILNGENLSEEDYIQATTNSSIKTQFNELEWVDGKIYANTYQFPSVAIINPENGAIEGVIDFRGLREKVTQHDKLDVLNGIAYNPTSKKLYVTGKNWDKVFEVEIQQK